LRKLQKDDDNLRALTTVCCRSDRVHCIRARYIIMLRRSFLLSLSVLAATSVAVLPASAQRGRDRDQAFPRDDWSAPRGEDDRQQREVPLSSVIRDLRMRYGGQHLDAQKQGDRYVIAWITEEGRRLTIEVDASSGRVISTR
jgi:hypothetical protein